MSIRGCYWLTVIATAIAIFCVAMVCTDSIVFCGILLAAFVVYTALITIFSAWGNIVEDLPDLGEK